MSIFNETRLTNETFKLDVGRMRRGWYSDKYFANIERTLSALAKQGYLYKGIGLRGSRLDVGKISTGDIEVEMQFFSRRKPFTLVVGVDKALSMLRHCTGVFREDGTFEETWQNLEVEAVQDGVIVPYPLAASGDSNPLRVRPVMKVRGRYRDLALLETPTLGALSRGSRIATNVYNTLVAARGKPVLFFPARFDAHEVQAADGYAYDIGVERFNMDYGEKVGAFVSTDAQGDWWGGAGGGTVAHAAIACFLGDTAEAMLAFSATVPAAVLRIALVDFNNDSIRDTLLVLEAMFGRYREAVDAGDMAEAEKYRLYGVRLDTSAPMRDVSVPPIGDKKLDCGVNPRLVWYTRQAIDRAWKTWGLPQEWHRRAQDYCESVRIVVSGGFGPRKITWFEELGVPADIYGVGSSLMSNDGELGTNTDFTADVVRVKIDGSWVDMAKVGRTACDNPDMEPVDLGGL